MNRFGLSLFVVCSILASNLATPEQALARPGQGQQAKAGSKTHYQVLGVRKNASRQTIRGAYRERANELHPDKTGGDKTKAEEFKQVVAAWETLSKPEARAAYDEQLAATQPRRTTRPRQGSERRVGNLAPRTFDAGVAVFQRVKLTGAMSGSVTIPEPANDADLAIAEQELTQLGIKLTNRTYITHFTGRGPQVRWTYRIDVTHPGGMQVRAFGLPAAQAFAQRVTDELEAAPSGRGEMVLAVNADVLEDMPAVISEHVAARVSDLGLGKITGVVTGQSVFSGSYVKLQFSKP